MKKNLPLIIGISLPFLMIIVVVVSIYLPRMFMNPTYSFLYTVSSYDCPPKVIYENGNNITQCESTSYTIDNGKVLLQKQTTSYNRTQKLYLYDIERDSTREISLEDAKAYGISSDSRSPDGYEVSYQYGGGAGIFDLFGGGYYNGGWVIKKGIASKPLSVTLRDRYYYNSGDIAFLGWVLK